ncbi:ubiquitin-conjugating enzyme E2 4 [Aaosphaeria arxii CBS 175.79]|uniref:Ubiquitin-conjugating enzyme E2 4 n=1 Tax=Aaosphaeria arxii CBS 175.79 TaxID=1450172 RepID=A0A6A5XEJ0_9PLEO|nr:ubiquitin-conjugating enzyme E2 4 [Aaosphaeria arxii CBS 175.79]KAF2011320.1 ubiquitin-conjugating enzyme E2 4 [Aaosphaeria arxii CBS 175.79]
MASSSRVPSATKRLLHELQSYHTNPNEALRELGPVNDDEITHWRAVMTGVPGTAYEGGQWLLDIQIPSTYPNAPPTIKFLTPICHPNVDFRTGEICLDLLKTSWTPAYTISATLTSIHQLLTSAEPDSPLNVDIAQLFRLEDYVAAEALIRFYTVTERYEWKRDGGERGAGRV